MLEYDFNQLDDDFITLWSHYILWNDAEKIIKPLERLAEKGQINAIQSWYLLKRQRDKNETIDAIVDGFYGDSFNEELAIAHREYDKSKSKLHELGDQIAHYQELGYELFKKCWNKGYGYTLPDEKNKYYVERDCLVNQYKNTEYARHLILAADLLENACRNTKRATVFERLFEIYASDPLILDNDRIEKKTIRRTGRILANYVKEHPEDSRAKFTLAKNYVFFSEKQNEQQMGSEILSELSKRPLKSCQYTTNKSTGR